MTFSDLLKSCSKGIMPSVVDNIGRIGTVTTIKDNGRHKGCAVKFQHNYDEWFWDSDENDKRSKYLRDLTLRIPTI